jgi:serine/threonine protein kinase
LGTAKGVNEVVAIKEITIEAEESEYQKKLIAVFTEFRQEVGIHQLLSHPNIVGLLDSLLPFLPSLPFLPVAFPLAPFPSPFPSLSPFPSSILLPSLPFPLTSTDLKGICLRPLGMVCEFVPCGDLYEYIHTREEEIPWKATLKISKDIATALQYLHGTFLFLF